MSSQPPDGPAPVGQIKDEAQVKPEEHIKAEDPISESHATPAESISNPSEAPTSTSLPATAPIPSKEATTVGFTKKDFEIMNGILHRLTNYRDQE